MPSEPKPIPGEKSPGLDARELDQLTNTALSRGSGAHTRAGDGFSAALLAFLAGRRRKGAKRRAP